jgi:ABC-type transport system involved in multi-copper enzyme maturation permease subunit
MSFSAALRSLASLPWRLWLRQSATIVRLELRKNFFSRRGFWIYLLAFAPTVIIGLHATMDRHGNMGEDTLVLAGIFQFYYLRLAIFFGCMGIFARLLRGEMIERSLHYYLLAPVRREVLVIAKFVAGLITSVFFFGVAVWASFLLMYSHFGARGSDYIWHGPGAHQLFMYLAITLLACLGYGAVFLAFSMTFKNPIVPGILVMGWEAINPVLPALLQKVSMIFYLRHLLPVQVPTKGMSIFALLAVVAEPVPGWLAVTGVTALTIVVLIYACCRVRRLEISYTTD